VRWRTPALVVALATLASSGCASGERKEVAAARPATLTDPRSEASLTTVTLTPEAERRLGIRTAPVERRPVPRLRTLGGEVVVPALPPGRDGVPAPIVEAPRSPAERTQAATALVRAGEEVARARIEVDAATVALQRAQAVARDGAGSARAADEATTRLALARAAFAAAQVRRDMVAAAWKAPSRPWIRVALYAGDLRRIDQQRTADVHPLGRDGATPGRPASPVPGPRLASPDAATVDVYYEMGNADGAFRLGERVLVTLPLEGDEEGLVVPASAVVRDIYGGEWVYEKAGPHTFVRHRTQVRFVTGPGAILATGPQPGAPVVVEGAAELFGTEFGPGA
jgi:hypothetical protein